MFHVGDYVFLIAISASVYLVSLRLLQLLTGKTDTNDHSQADGDGGRTGAEQ